MSASSNIGAFLCGVAAATTAFIILYRPPNNNQTATKSQCSIRNGSAAPKEGSSSSSSTASSAAAPEVDSPDLPLRLIRKAETAILKRTSRFLVVVERCTNDYNYSAILRTVEALGVQNVWLIDPPRGAHTLPSNTTNDDENAAPVRPASPNTLPQKNDLDNDNKSKTNNNNKTNLRTSTGKVIRTSATEIEARCNHHLFAQKAAEWLTIREFPSTSACIAALRADRRTIWATDLSQEAECLTADSLAQSSSSRDGVIPSRLAIVFGTEAVGCSAELFAACDKKVYLPLVGFADSLNLSVATALCVFQLFCLAPDAVGDMSEEERHELRQRFYTKLASQRILTSSQKKRRKELTVRVKTVENYTKRRDGGEFLQKEQLEKIDKWQSAKEQLRELDEKLEIKARQSVDELVNNPPLPLNDMRRADEHRTCFVGKGTKAKHSEDWKDMPATTNFDTMEVNTSAFFRERGGGTLKMD